MTGDPVTTITGVAQHLGDQLIAVGGAVLPVAATVLALTIGWRFAKRFVKG